MFYGNSVDSNDEADEGDSDSDATFTNQNLKSMTSMPEPVETMAVSASGLEPGPPVMLPQESSGPSGSLRGQDIQSLKKGTEDHTTSPSTRMYDNDTETPSKRSRMDPVTSSKTTPIKASPVMAVQAKPMSTKPVPEKPAPAKPALEQAKPAPVISSPGLELGPSVILPQESSGTSDSDTTIYTTKSGVDMTKESGSTSGLEPTPFGVTSQEATDSNYEGDGSSTTRSTSGLEPGTPSITSKESSGSQDSKSSLIKGQSGTQSYHSKFCPTHKSDTISWETTEETDSDATILSPEPDSSPNTEKK